MHVSFYWSSYLLKNFCVSNPDWRRLFWNVELCWTFWKVGLSPTLLNNFSFSKFSITDHENLTTKNQKVQCSWRVFSSSSYLFFSCFWIVCWFCSNAICGKKLQVSYRVLSEYNTNFTGLVNKEMYGSHERVVNWILKVKGARNTNLDVALDWVIDSQVLSPIQTVIIVDNSYNYTWNCI